MKQALVFGIFAEGCPKFRSVHVQGLCQKSQKFKKNNSFCFLKKVKKTDLFLIYFVYSKQYQLVI
ncbi:MAG TPA: hypothetical protein DCG69_00850 [Bacteroidales bacterium]|nr:hypothetical protein [Bacteroidales bacterium]